MLGGLCSGRSKDFLVDPDMRKDEEREEMLQPSPGEFPNLPGAWGWDAPAGVGFIYCSIIMNIIINNVNLSGAVDG